MLLSKLLVISKVEHCYAIITDSWYASAYDDTFFHYPRQPLPLFYLKVEDLEDLKAPNYQTIRVLKQINCDLHFITILNGLQVKRFLLFLEKYRVLNTKRKYVFLYDERLISKDMYHVWRNMISSVFIQPSENGR